MCNNRPLSWTVYNPASVFLLAFDETVISSNFFVTSLRVVFNLVSIYAFRSKPVNFLIRDLYIFFHPLNWREINYNTLSSDKWNVLYPSYYNIRELLRVCYDTVNLLLRKELIRLYITVYFPYNKIITSNLRKKSTLKIQNV